MNKTTTLLVSKGCFFNQHTYNEGEFLTLIRLDLKNSLRKKNLNNDLNSIKNLCPVMIIAIPLFYIREFNGAYLL